MKIVFSGFPAPHHLLPFAPLGRAAAALGHRTALLTDPALGARPAADLPGTHVLPARSNRPVATPAPRARDDPRVRPPAPAAVAELFVGTEPDLAVEDAIDAVWTWRPDLIVSGTTDVVGPLVAATLDVPHAVLSWSPALPEEFAAATAALTGKRFAQRGLVPPTPVAVVDLCPPALQPPGFVTPPHHLPMRPDAPRRVSSYLDLPRPDRGRPVVLVALRTVSRDVVADVLRFLPPRFDVRVSVGSGEEADLVGEVDPGVRVLPPGPWDDLMHGVDVVVGSGEAGSLLGTLAHGRPTVLFPRGVDQQWHATRAAAVGAARVIDAADEVGPAVSRVVEDPSFRAAARSVQAEIAAMPTPTAVLTTLLARPAPPTGNRAAA